MEKRKLLNKIIKHFNPWRQELQAVEEMSELTKELMKHTNRGSNNIAEIIGEIADVSLMLDQLCIIFEVTPEALERMKDEKIARTINRMERK